MEYRITKDCGTGWAATIDQSAASWGVSESQRQLAARVAPGDIFLHYIDHVHAWAGYSTVTGEAEDNQRDSQPDWLAALPIVIPIKPGVWLHEGQCEETVVVHGLPEKHYERQVAFTSIPVAEAILIIKAIESASASKPTVSQGFHKRWMDGAESYYKGIVKGLAQGKCRMCRQDATSWIALARVSLSREETDSIRDAFLDAAHIDPNCKGGPMTPVNLRALCPNCHRIVDRLPDEQRERLLRGLGYSREGECV